MTTNDLVKINKSYFILAASTAAKTAIFVAFPYLNVPPVNFLINKAIDWLISKIADALDLLLFFEYIDFRVDQQGKEYVDAAHLAMKVPTEENIRKADEAFKSFAHFNSI
jgi:hypothetical protein